MQDRAQVISWPLVTPQDIIISNSVETLWFIRVSHPCQEEARGWHKSQQNMFNVSPHSALSTRNFLAI